MCYGLRVRKKKTRKGNVSRVRFSENAEQPQEAEWREAPLPGPALEAD